MSMSNVSIKNPVFAWMLMIGLIAFGALGFSRMGISQLPDIDQPILSIRVTWEGASPEVVETEVTDVIEDAVMGVEGIKEVSSSSSQGQATITVEFHLDRNIDVALQEVQSKISQAQRNLPAEIDPPVISKTNPEDQPIMWVALTGDRSTKEMMEYTKDQLKDAFTTVPGVGEAFLGGFVEPNLRVWLDKDKMRASEITVDDVINAIRTQHAELPAGRIETSKQDLNIRVMGEAGSVEDFAKIIIPSRQGQPLWKTIRIGDIARIEDGLDDIRRISRSAQKPAVGIGIKKQRGSNAVDVAHGVIKKVAELKKTLPHGLDLNIVFDSTRFIEEAAHELKLHLFLAALLTGVVCFFFLGSFTSTVNVLLAIPVSIVGTFTALYFLHFTLNTFTLLALTLSIGIVVDDAIMVLENIVRYREQGHSKVKAALLGAREITSAAVAASIAVLAIFMPVIFMPGILGKFLFQFGVTLSVAVALSLVEALTITPMRCSQFLSVGDNSSFIARNMDRGMTALTSFYRRRLSWVLRHRVTTIVLAVVVFSLVFPLSKSVKREFIPSQDQSRFLVRLMTPVGSSLEFTDKVMKQAETKLVQHPAMDQYFVAVGGFGGTEADTGNIFVTLKQKNARPFDPELKRRPTQADMMDWVRKQLSPIPGTRRVVIQDLSQQGFSAQRGFPVEVSLLGRDWDQLSKTAESFQAEMSKGGLMTDVDTDYRLGRPEIRVLPNRTEAAARGVSVDAIGNSINAMIGGVRIGKYTRGGRRYDIRLRLNEAGRPDAESIKDIWVRNSHGEVVPLSHVVTLKEEPTLVSISRKDRQRAIRVYANVAPGKSQGEALNEMNALAKRLLPEGTRMVFSGSAATYGESNQGLIFVFILGIFTAYMVLATQYNSFIHPFTVLLALPFSVTGAFIALWLTGSTLSLYSAIGLILLMGIVKKNAILLVDFTNEQRKQGKNVFDALMEACPIRLRPIIMTSIATVAAVVPTAFSKGAGSETRAPMAQVVIGGVLLSTLLTLFVVPAAYSLLARLESHKHDADLAEALKELGELPADSPKKHGH